MHHTQLGAVTVESVDSGVRFVLSPGPDGEAQSLIVDNAHVGALQRFLRSHADPAERRVGFRVPIESQEEKAQLSVLLNTKTRELMAEPMDLSLTGLLVRAEDHGISTGDRVLATLTEGEHTTRLMGEAVRVDAGLVALHFPETLKDGELAPPQTLLLIYRAVERAWLKARRDHYMDAAI